MKIAAICATPRVGATALLRSLATVIPGAAEHPDAKESGGIYLTMIHWQQMPVAINGKFVYLYRRDRVAQAISWAAGAATGRFHPGQAEPRPAGSLDRESVQRAIDAIGQQDRAWRRWLAGRPTLELCYEDDIQPDATAAARRVLTWLGVAGDPKPPDLHPVDRETKLAWRQAWEASR